jgi:hypothetical protein
MATYTILGGTHFGLPPTTFFTTKKNSFTDNIEFQFTENNKYIFNNENQYDWNKLYGWKGEYFKPRFNTGMVGWRWNPQIQMFQIIPYFHIGSSAHTFDDAYIINVPVNTIAKAQIKIEGKAITITLECNNVVASHYQILSKEYSKFYKIIPWFGGQEKCPHTMKFQINNENNN